MNPMTERHSALIIASFQYEDPVLRQLVAPAQDAEALAKVLQDPAIGGFEVQVVLNEPSYKVSQEIEAFFAGRQRDDLLLLYFSCHGIKDEDGRLYFATPNTQHSMLRSTAVRAADINEIMLACRSRRQVLVLDCCHSGAFAKGLVAKGGTEVGTKEDFEGRGRVILTASDAMQYSFEGSEVKGEGVRSIFTSTLVRGLESGEADLDADGLISLDELYDYVHKRVAEEAPQQSPRKWEFDVEGEIIIARNPHPTAAQLPRELQESVEDARPWVRLGAVQQLERLLSGKHQGLVLAAREALLALKDHDDSFQVRSAAEQCLAAYEAQRLREEEAAREQESQAKERAGEEQERREREKAERERLDAEKERVAREKAEQERLAKEKAEAERAGATERERLAAEKAEAERLAMAQAEAERQSQKAEKERLWREKVEQERRAEEKAEQQRLTARKAQAESCLKRGKELLNKSEASGASAAFREAISQHESEEAQYYLGLALYQEYLQETTYAEYGGDYGTSASPDPKSILDKAIQAFRRALVLWPEFADAHSSLGRALCDMGDLEGALAECWAALSLKLDLAKAHDDLGYVLFKKSDLQAALWQYRIACELEPNNETFRFNYEMVLKAAAAQRTAHEAEAAERAAQEERLAQEKAEHEPLERERAEQQRLAAEKAEAERRAAEIARAERLARWSRRAKVWGPICVLVVGLSAGVWHFVTRPPAVNTKTEAETHKKLGDGRYEKGDVSGAIAEYREAIRLKPDNALAHYGLGNALHKAGDGDGAIAEYREAVRLKPDWAEAHYNLAVGLDRKGDQDSAIAEYREAVRLKPDWAEAHYNLGRLFANKREQDTDAITRQLDEIIEVGEYSAAYRLAPDNSKYRAAYEKLTHESVKPTSSSPNRVPPNPKPPAGHAAPIRVAGRVQQARCIFHPEPIYPSEARHAHIQGTVRLEAVIGRDGTVQDLKLVSSAHPLLVKAAMDAVKRWRYEPTRLNGEPVAVVTEIAVDFKLSPNTESRDDLGTTGVGEARDNPPVPIYQPGAPYTDEARRNKIHGTVVLSIMIDAQGSVSGATVTRSLESSLDKSAVDTVRTWKFKPAMRKGVPVPASITVNVNFNLY